MKYGLWGSLRLLISVVYTKIYFPRARIIRLPFDIRNRKFIKLGKRFTSGFGCRLEALIIQDKMTPLIKIGDDVQINDFVHIAAGESVKIGNHVLVASKVFISDLNHGSYNKENSDHPDMPPNYRPLSTKPVIIEDNVWLGESVCVLPGVTIGKGSIIGAMSVVTKDIPPYSIAVGVPAIIIKEFNFQSKLWESVK